MKIVDITEFYSQRGGGIRSHLTTRGHVLCHLGHDHTVIAPGPQDDVQASVAPTQASLGHGEIRRIAGPALPYDRTYHLLGRLDKVRSAVRGLRPDVLEAHSPYLAAAAVLASGRGAARVRTAFWHADHLGTYVEPTLGRLFGPNKATVLARPLWSVVRTLLRPFDAVFAAGVAQARRLRQAGVPRVIHVPFGIDVLTFCPGARSEVRRREIARGAPGALLVAVGRLALEKRWDVVLDAFARVRARRQATLVVFGDGPERSRLEQRAGPGVTFAGFENDRARIAAAVASADILVHGCPCETYGLSVAEAAACATPVVVPDAGGARERADPSCSETYRAADAESCAAAIERLLGRDRSDLRASALAAAARTVTLEQHFGRVLSVYDDLLRGC